MKKRFLAILYEMRRRYNSPWNWIGLKRKNHVEYGLCHCYVHIISSVAECPSLDERALFWALLREEAEKFEGCICHSYWWERGKLKPRRKTINVAIKRIENSNI